MEKMVTDLHIEFEKYSEISALARRQGVTWSEMAHRLIEAGLEASQNTVIPRSRPGRVDLDGGTVQAKQLFRRKKASEPDSVLQG
jgi:hypothetical protein